MRRILLRSPGLATEFNSGETTEILARNLRQARQDEKNSPYLPPLLDQESSQGLSPQVTGEGLKQGVGDLSFQLTHERRIDFLGIATYLSSRLETQFRDATISLGAFEEDLDAFANRSVYLRNDKEIRCYRLQAPSVPSTSPQ